VNDEQQQARPQDVDEGTDAAASTAGADAVTPDDNASRIDTGRLLGSAAILNALIVTLIGTAVMVYSKWPEGQESIRFHGMIIAAVALFFILTNFQTVRDPASRRSWTAPAQIVFLVVGSAALYYLATPMLYVGIGLPVLSVLFQIFHRPAPAAAS
jgi:hypothetical protein